MRFPIHNVIPSSERLIRTLFWTFWTLTVASTAYGLIVESFGIGLFLPNQGAPKFHMLGAR